MLAMRLPVFPTTKVVVASLDDSVLDTFEVEGEVVIRESLLSDRVIVHLGEQTKAFPADTSFFVQTEF